MGYGAIRNPAANALTGMTGQFAGQYTDEILMGVASWLLAKSGKGMIANIGRKGLVVENANIGAILTSGMIANPAQRSMGGI